MRTALVGDWSIESLKNEPHVGPCRQPSTWALNIGPPCHVRPYFGALEAFGFVFGHSSWSQIPDISDRIKPSSIRGTPVNFGIATTPDSNQLSRLLTDTGRNSRLLDLIAASLRTSSRLPTGVFFWLLEYHQRTITGRSSSHAPLYQPESHCNGHQLGSGLGAASTSGGVQSSSMNAIEIDLCPPGAMMRTESQTLVAHLCFKTVEMLIRVKLQRKRPNAHHCSYQHCHVS